MLYMLTGPSGSGKTTLVREVLQFCPDAVQAVSMTSRPPRPGEVEGVDYYFVSREEFERLIQLGVMIEYTEFGGNYYGLSRHVLEKAMDSNIGVVIVEQRGREILKEMFGDDVRSVYVNIDSQKALSRLKNRDGWSKAKKRIKADIENGLYNTRGYDCVLKNDSTKKELLFNFLNYVEAVDQWKRLYKEHPKAA